MNYEQKYNEALERARKEYKTHESFNGFREMLLCIFPELEESDDERIRREIITYLSTVDDKELIPYESWIAWIKKQSEQKTIEKTPNGGIVLEDFNGGDGFYKVNLAYLSKEQVDEIESIIKKWNHGLSEDERIRKALITAVSGTFNGNTLWHTDVTREKALAWLEKQAADKPYYTELLGYFEIGKRLNHSVEEIIDWLKSKI